MKTEIETTTTVQATSKYWKGAKAIVLVLFITGLAVPPELLAACGPSDIAVDKLKGHVKRNYIYIVGRLRNNCSIETGVQIKVTIYNKAGDILAVDDSWPASVSNIPAKSDFPFQHMTERLAGFESFDVRIIETKTW